MSTILAQKASFRHSGQELARIHHFVVLAKDWPESSNKDVYYTRSQRPWIPRSSRGM